MIAQLAATIGAASFLPLGEPGGSFWLPVAGSTNARSFDMLFYTILGVCTFFFLLIVVLMAAFVFLYRSKPGGQAQPSASHNTLLEVVWTVIPVGVVIYIFYQGFLGFMETRRISSAGYEVSVVARQWSWSFIYPNGVVESTLHVPVDQPVRLTMRSEDVIHSLFIPAFRIKTDVVPGRYTYMWFRARRPGEYDILCAEYCGTGHSDMASKVVVQSPAELEEWLKQAGDVLKNNTPVAAGKILYLRYGCNACHSLDGTPVVGPTFKGIWGETHRFSNAPPHVVDEDYVRESILLPGAKIREGFENKMPSFKGQISDKEIDAVIALIKSLK